jgi:lipoate---protein ligase
MKIYLIHAYNLSVLEQLRYEEALVRADDRNWCIINEGSSDAVVLGISGKVEEHVNVEQTQAYDIPIIRRFSGGGTVVVDEKTFFVSFIFNSAEAPCESTPQCVMKWTGDFYSSAYAPMPLQLRERDYVVGERKCGGNAQYFCRDRWIHHTSFLWDYDAAKMQCLCLPERQPEYRQQRDHSDFLCTLKEYFTSKEKIYSMLRDELGNNFTVKEAALKDIEEVMQRPHRRMTVGVSPPKVTNSTSL